MVQSLSDLYSMTIDRAYYTAAYLMRDERLTLDLLLISYARAQQYLSMLGEGVGPGELMDRIVAASGMTMLAQVHEEDYRKIFAQKETVSQGYAKRELLSSVCLPQSGEDDRNNPYERAGNRLVTALRIMNLPESLAGFFYYELSMSPEEIAAAMGISEELVGRHLTAACNKLRQMASDWIRQGRIPADVDPMPFLLWGFARDQKRDRYRGEDLLPLIQEHREELLSGKGLFWENPEQNQERTTGGQGAALGLEAWRERLSDGLDWLKSKFSS